MSNCTMEGTCLAILIRWAVPICQQAEHFSPRTGPGRKPEIPDWVMAVLVTVAILKKRKSKSAQYRFLFAHRKELLTLLQTDRFPARSTYFDRYRRAHYLLKWAIQLQGKLAVQYGLASAQCVAVDKSVVASCGTQWNTQQKCLPRGADPDATWTFSSHHHWVQGYGYEVVVTADKQQGAVWPLLASVETASVQENRMFAEKLSALPKSTQFVLADKGYDSNTLADAFEHTPAGQQRGCRFICSQIKRHRRTKKNAKPWKDSPRRLAARQRRQARAHFFESRAGRALFSRRGATIEPFNEWFKSLFELKQTWHRGLDNNRTQMLAALFAYQLLLRFNHKKKRPNGRIRWILDTL